MSKKHAFTLVELLVVIGIIALLVSMLLPALSRVQNQAQLTACAARMRDLVQATHMYANDNKGALPPFRNDKGSPTYTLGPAGSAAGLMNYIWTIDFSSTDRDADGKLIEGALVGRLIAKNYLKTEKVVRCPSGTGQPDYINNYPFNMHVAQRTVAGVRYLQPQWKKVNRYGIVRGGDQLVEWQTGFVDKVITPLTYKRALMTDPIYNAGNANNQTYATHALRDRRAWNMAYIDGSVTAVNADNRTNRVIDRWTRYLDLSEALQDAASTGTVKLSAIPFNTYYNAIPVDPQ